MILLLAVLVSTLFATFAKALPSLGINNVSVTEGNSGSISAVFTVTLSEQSSEIVTVDYATSDGTATAANADYETISLPITIVFEPFETTKTISVSVIGDSAFEPDETISVNLSNATNAAIEAGQGQLTILNDDCEPPTAAVAGDGTICLGNSTDLNVALTGTPPWTVVWSDGVAQTIETSPAVRAVSPAASQTYTIATVSDSHSCIGAGSGSATVTVNPLPVLSVTPDPTICPGGAIELSVTGALTYEWSPPAGLSATTGAAVTANPASTTSYAVIGTDANGCQSSATVTVTVADTTAPIPVCNDISIQLDATGNASIVWQDIGGGSTDNCGIDTLASNVTPGLFTCANVGPNLVTVTIFDGSGNSATCQATVMVEDHVAPMARCKNIVVQLDPSGQVSIAPSDVDDGSADTCGILSMELDRTTFDCASLGDNTVTLTVTDHSGNQSSCSTTVTVEDRIAPTITGVADLIVGTDPGLCTAVVAGIAPTSFSDNCPSPVVTYTLSGATTGSGGGDASGTVFQAGVTTVTYTITDVSNNSSTCVIQITVQDRDLPTIELCPSNVTQINDTGHCGAIVSFSEPTFSDNCPGATIQQTEGLPSGAFFPVGATTNAFVVTDASGNTQACANIVTITDAQAPEITGPANLAAPAALGLCGNSVVYEITASDNCGELVSTNQLSGLSSGSWFPVGQTTNTFEVVDSAGHHSAPFSFVVTVQDTEPPVIACPGNRTVDTDPGQCTAIVNDIAPVSFGDNCPGATVTYLVTGATTVSGMENASGTAFNKGSSTVTYTVTDASSNVTSCSFTVTVQDHETPSLVSPADVQVSCGDSVDLSNTGAASATDNCDAGWVGPLQSAWLSEIHYDPTGSPDAGEFVEVTGVAGTNLGSWRLVFYRADGTIYRTTQLSGVIPDGACGFGAVAFDLPSDGFQNGPNNGIALVMDPWDQVAQFISYEGIVTAREGPAAGSTSSPIAVQETAVASGLSLQYDGSVWTGPIENTKGQVNAGQVPSSGRGLTVVSFVDSLAPGACANAGSITRTWTARDSSGNRTSTAQIITIADATAPWLQVPSDLSVQCDESTEPSRTGTAAATDNCNSGVSSVWINEFHYDDSGSGPGEFVEIAGIAGVDLGDYVLVYYNGADGKPYGTQYLSGTITQQGPCEYGSVTFDPGAATGVQRLQNGPADGIALVHAASQRVIQFISYEGSLMALTGPAAGLTSTDVGVSESNSTPIGSSIHLIGTGNNWGSFSWNDTLAASPGALNASQDFVLCQTGVAISYLDASTQDPDVTSAAHYNYTISRSWTATDRCGNPATQSQIITVRDTVPPIITLVGTPAIVECHTSYIDAGSIAMDNCASDLSAQIVATSTVDVNSVGTYTVAYSVKDPSGNEAVPVVRTVQVVDTTAPVLALTGANPQVLECHTAYAELGATATDTCAGNLTGAIVIDASAVNVDAVGSYTVSYTVSDGFNSTTVNRTVQVVDTTAPVLTLTGPNPQVLECHTAYVELGATAIDTCAENLTGAIVTDASAVNVNTVGTYTVSYIVSDGFNSSTVNRAVQVVDTTAPVLTLTGANPQILECHTSYLEQGATVTDTCAGTVTSAIVIDASAVDVNTVGSYTVSYTVSDGFNSTTVNRAVQVVDTTAPVLALTGANPQVLECHTAYVELGATAIDTCAGDLTSAIVTDASAVNVNAVGSYTVSYIVSDGFNSTTVNRTVQVVDTTAPVLTLTGANPHILECHTAYAELGATAIDTCAGNLTGAIVIDASAVNVNAVGSYTVSYIVSDGFNSTTINRTVQVVDTTAPVLTLTGPNPQVLECHTAYVELGATAIDTCAGNLTSAIAIDASAVDVNTVGSYTVSYTVSDGFNTSTVNRAVQVVDTTAPVLTLVGAHPQVLECHTAYAELGAMATDTCAGNLTGSIVIDASALNLNAVGSYRVSYTVSDGFNSTTINRTVQVVDTTAPVLTLIGANPQVLECHTAYVELGATATDTCAGNLTSAIVIDGSAVNVNAVGTYTVSYAVSDEFNSTSVNRTVQVVDTTAPVLTLTGANPQIRECHAAYAELGATATDTCGGDLTSAIVIDASAVNVNAVGSYTVSYTVSDGFNSTTVNRTVQVVDTTAPVLTRIPSGEDMACNPSNVPTDLSVQAWMRATDSPGPVSVNVYHVDAVMGCRTKRTFTLIATDESGNNAVTTVAYTWTTDTTPPTLSDVPTGADLGCNPLTSDLPTDERVRALVSASDACTVRPVIQVTHEDSTRGCVTTRTFSISASDDCGNRSSTATVVYTWTVDSKPPVVTAPPDIVQCGGDAPAPAQNAAEFLSSGGRFTDTCSASVVFVADVVSGSLPKTVSRTYRVVDACGNFTDCVQRITIAGLAAAAITANGPMQFCEGGSVRLMASAGRAYLWSNGATTQSITVNDSGSYAVLVTDINGCTVTSAPATVRVRPALLMDAKAGVIDCARGTTTILASATGGMGPYEYSLDASRFQTSPDFHNITAGAHTVTVKDVNGCIAAKTLTITESAAVLAITSEPPNQSVCVGERVTFKVGATGTGLKYQWRRGLTNIPEATAASYTVASATAADAGEYVVAVEDACGNMASVSVRLHIHSAPTITREPMDVVACAGSLVTLTVSALGDGLKYQWRKEGTDIPGATNANYLLPLVGAFASGKYSVVVQGCGSVESRIAAVQIRDSISPTMECPPHVIREAQPNRCGAFISDAELGSPAAFDECSGVTIRRTGVPEDNMFPVGTTLINYTATNKAGNQSACTQRVTVEDRTPPVPQCKNITVYFTDSPVITVTPAEVDAGSTDNCGLASLSISKNSFDHGDIGPNPVTLTATDHHGNSASCVAMVTVAAPTLGGAGLQIGEMMLNEGNAGVAEARFPVTLKQAMPVPIAVKFATQDDSARAGLDYESSSGWLTFQPGELRKDVVVKVLGDTLNEADERFFIQLTEPNSPTIISNRGTATIRDDDPVPVVSIDAGPVLRSDETGNVVITVSLSAPSGQEVRVDYSTEDGSAVAGEDYDPVKGTLEFTGRGRLWDSLAKAESRNELGKIPQLEISAKGGQRVISWEAGENTFELYETSSLADASEWRRVDAQVEIQAGHYSVRLDDFASARFYELRRFLIFAPGELSKAITVHLKADAQYEHEETFFFNLSNAENAIIAKTREIITIANSEPAPVLTIDDVTITETQRGKQEALFKVTLAGQTAVPAIVEFRTVDGTAKAGFDFDAASGRLVFAPGEHSKVIPILIDGDASFEANETFSVHLVNPVDATIARAEGTAMILNDDALPALKIEDVQLHEGDDGTVEAKFTVTLSAPSLESVEVRFATEDGTARAGSDYASTQGLITFAPAMRHTSSMRIPDLRIEPDSHLGLASGNLNITWTSSTNAFEVQVAPSLESGEWRSLNLPPQVEGNNYKLVLPMSEAHGFFRLAPVFPIDQGETRRTIAIPINRDRLVEIDETFFVHLSEPKNATIAKARGAATILNDDSRPTIGIHGVSMNEKDTGTNDAVFAVTLSHPTDETVTIDFMTVDDSARAGDDYADVRGKLTFNPGDVAKTISVTVLGDLTNESDENFLVKLSNAVNATLSVREAKGTILNDDQLPSLSISDVVFTEGNSGTSDIVLEVTLSSASGQIVQVNFTTVDGTARLGTDYLAKTGILTILPGELAKQVTVRAIGDSSAERTEMFSVLLSNPANAVLTKASGAVMILDSDKTNEPPQVQLTSPKSEDSFLAGLSISLAAHATDADGTVVRVDFYANGNLIGGAVSEPFGILWSDVAEGNYTLTAIATDDEGATGEAASINITAQPDDGRKRVAIVQGSEHPDTAKLQSYLTDMGFGSQIFHRDDADLATLRQFDLVIWDDPGNASIGITPAEVDLFVKLYQANIPLYFIGQGLARAESRLSASNRMKWSNLTRLQPTTRLNGAGGIEIVEFEHRLSNGPFGTVADFKLTDEHNAGSQLGTGEIVVARSSGADKLLVYEDPATLNRTVTQDFLTFSGGNLNSRLQREKLFRNAVWWLLDLWSPGPFLNVSLTVDADSAAPKAGDTVVLTLTVQHTGESEASAVVLTLDIPSQAQLISATSLDTEFQQDENQLFCELGRLGQAESKTVTIVLRPMAPGSLRVIGRISLNQPEAVPRDNVGEITLEAGD